MDSINLLHLKYIVQFFFLLQVAVVFYYLCAVTLQYIAPIIICLYFCLMYKTLGDYSWQSLFIQSPDQCPVNNTIVGTEPITPETSNLRPSTPFAGEIHYTLENLKSVCISN